MKRNPHIYVLYLIILSVLFISGYFPAGCGSSSLPQINPTPTSVLLPSPTSGNTDYTKSDFTPPSGADPNFANNNQAPNNNRIMIATSTDSLNFTRTGKIISDQADVPCGMKDAAGRIFVYYVTFNPGNLRNKIVAAVSVDNGNNWAYKIVKISGVVSDNQIGKVDPTAVLLSDGRIRLYFTWSKSISEKPGPYSAISSDGLNFTMESQNEVVSPHSEDLLDPCVYLIGNLWHLYNGPFLPGNGGNYHFTSTNGTQFTQAEFTNPGNMLMANILQISDTSYRVYGFPSNSPSQNYYIGSAISTDGNQWTIDTGKRLELDMSSSLENVYVKDPGIVKTNSENYLMFYVTRMIK